MTTGEAQLVAASGVLCGTLLALFGYLFRAHVVHNPGQVPFADWMGRDVALGCLSFVSIWGPVAAVVVFLSLGTLGLFEPTATDPNDLGWPRVFMPSLGVALGLPWSFQFAKSRWAASWPSGLAQIAQRTDESTTLHFRSCRRGSGPGPLASSTCAYPCRR